MSDRLAQLIERAKRYQMTPEDIERQAISFAFGNLGYEDSSVTREQIQQAARELKGKP